MRRLLLAAWLVLVSAAVHAAYIPTTYPVIDLMAYPGASGDGVTDNAVPLQQAFNAAVNGGMIRMPCGVFKSTATPGVTIAAGKHVRIVGSGADCTELYMAGAAANGPSIAKADKFSSVDIEDLAITTDQSSGSLVCLTLSQADADSSPAFAATSTINRVTCRGHDLYGAGSQFWASGLALSNVSNVNSFAYVFQGLGQKGNAVLIHGDASDGTYAVGFHFFGPIINQCNAGIFFGDWVQSISIESAQITLCVNGVTTGTGGGSPASDLLDQLSIVNSRIHAFNCDVCVSDPFFANLQLTNNTFITAYDVGISASPIGVEIKGASFNVSGNTFNGPGTHGTAIVLGSCYALGGAVNGNSIVNYNVGFGVISEFACLTTVNANSLKQNVSAYSIDAGATGRVEITDTEGRTFASIPTCNAVTKYSQFLMIDSPSTTFYATLTVGGAGAVVQAVCDGTDLKVH